ncbi:hypothetical protein HK104_005834 [Borealophlyctis nickersoniae]|nr:hypothetical protein HK104_005834 [Borealophlyctis nickersoniae]
MKPLTPILTFTLLLALSLTVAAIPPAAGLGFGGAGFGLGATRVGTFATGVGTGFGVVKREEQNEDGGDGVEVAALGDEDEGSHVVEVAALGEDEAGAEDEVEVAETATTVATTTTTADSDAALQLVKRGKGCKLSTTGLSSSTNAEVVGAAGVVDANAASTGCPSSTNAGAVDANAASTGCLSSTNAATSLKSAASAAAGVEGDAEGAVNEFSVRWRRGLFMGNVDGDGQCAFLPGMRDSLFASRLF